MSAQPFDVRPVAMGSVAWGSMWIATADNRDWWAIAFGVVAMVLVIAAFRASRLMIAVGCLAAACLVVGSMRVEALARDPVAELASSHAVAEVEMRLSGAPRQYEATGIRPARWMSTVTVLAIDARGERWRSGVPVVLTVSGDAVGTWSRLPWGTVVTSTVTLAPAEQGSGLAAQVRARGSPRVLAYPQGGDAAVHEVRSGLKAAAATLAAEPRGLVPALVVGDTSGMPRDLTEQFKTTGLTHLTAVSGANLVLLLAFIRMVLVGVGVRGRALMVCLAGGVAAFVALCLGEPSVVRAAGMGLVGLVALGQSGRGKQGLRYLAVAVLLVVVIDPWMSRSIGFTLSVAASAGLLVWAGRWADTLARWMPRWLAEAVSVPIAAQLATQPVVSWLSGSISVVGIVANAVAGPLVGPATVLGFMAAGLSVVFMPAASLCAWLAGWCAQGLCWIARLGDALPGASVSWPTSPWALVVLSVGCLALAGVLPALFARPWPTLAAALALVVLLLRAPTPAGWPPSAWSMVACDVGQGDAFLFRAGPRQAMAVDTGPDPRALARCLDQVGVVEVPVVVLTHLHADHAAGITALTRRGVQSVVTSAVRTPTFGDNLVATLEAAGAERFIAREGTTVTVGDVRVDVIAAPELTLELTPAEGESSSENDASLLLRITVGGFSVLAAGDVEETGQQERLRWQREIDTDVLVVPHHGSSRQWPPFLAASTPEIAVISVGAKNDYGHPTKKTLGVVSAITPNVMRTDLHGSIAVSKTEQGWQVTTQRRP